MLMFALIAAVVVAIITSAILGGLYYGFSVAVLPGLLAAGDETYVTGMRRINQVILNPWFLLAFVGAPAIAVLAAVLHGIAGTPGLWWTIAAAVLNVAGFITTAAVNVPLNNALEASAPNSGPTSATDARARFHPRWLRWNSARAALHLLAVACLLTAALTGLTD